MPTSESLEAWGEYLAISVPATIMICASWWGFEICVIIAAYLGTDQQAAMAIAQNIAVLIFGPAVGFQESICSMVGASIGANNVPLAKKIAKITFLLSFAFCLLLSLLLFAFRSPISSLFTADQSVSAIMLRQIPVNALVFLPDAAQGILAGTVRALGIQKQVAGYVLLAHYTVGLPLGILLAFKFDFKI